MEEWDEEEEDGEGGGGGSGRAALGGEGGRRGGSEARGGGSIFTPRSTNIEGRTRVTPSYSHKRFLSQEYIHFIVPKYLLSIFSFRSSCFPNIYTLSF